jgi:type II secretory pathway pseudopilin PulG
MRRHSDQDGFALILLIGIVAALAILASMLVVMLDNQQHATFKERTSKTSLYYADAALSSAASAAENDTTWLTNSSYTVNQTTYNQVYSASFGSSAPTPVYAVYDNLNPVNTAVTHDSNGDGEVWVQASVTWNGKTSSVRELVSSSTKTSILPKAAAWTDTNMVLSGTSNIYGVNNDGTADDSGAPYVTSVMCGGNFTGNSSSNLAYPGHTVQSLGLDVNGSVSGVPTSVNHTTGGVGLLSDYFDQAHQANLMFEAQQAISNQSTLFDSAGTSVTSHLDGALLHLDVDVLQRGHLHRVGRLRRADEHGEHRHPGDRWRQDGRLQLQEALRGRQSHDLGQHDLQHHRPLRGRQPDDHRHHGRQPHRLPRPGLRRRPRLVGGLHEEQRHHAERQHGDRGGHDRAAAHVLQDPLDRRRPQ